MTRVEGVEALRWGTDRENTFLGALAAAARAMGDDTDYTALMGASGAAFRLLFHQPEWCPSSPDATCGYDHASHAFEALGRDFVVRHAREPSAELRSLIIENLQAGRPVIAIELIATPDWGVICGERDNGKTLLCRTYWDADPGTYALAEKWPWALVFPGARGTPPDARETLRRAAGIAVELWDTPAFDKYASGRAAYAAWIRDLRDDARRFEDERIDRDAHINGWCYASLLDARLAAERYLRASGEENAADLYAAVVKRLRDGRSHVLLPREAKEGHLWTATMRAAQAAVLEEVAELEARAVGALRAVAA